MVVGRNNQHFYVNEMAITSEGQFVIPLKWIFVDGKLCGDCWQVHEVVMIFLVFLAISSSHICLRMRYFRSIVPRSLQFLYQIFLLALLNCRTDWRDHNFGFEVTVFLHVSSLHSCDIFLSDQDEDIQMNMPNPWRDKAGGRPVYCIQLNLWQDDVSGNVSKQWNKHLLFCMTMAGLPKKLLAQEYFTRYIACSPNATALEITKSFTDALK